MLSPSRPRASRHQPSSLHARNHEVNQFSKSEAGDPKGYPLGPESLTVCYSSTHGAENIPKSRPYKFKNNASTLSKPLQSYIEKLQKNTCLITKMFKIEPPNANSLHNFDRKNRNFVVISHLLDLKNYQK